MFLIFICFLICLFLYYCKRFIGFALTFVTGILEVFHKCQTERVYKGTQTRHGNVQRMPEYQYQTAEQPSRAGPAASFTMKQAG